TCQISGPTGRFCGEECKQKHEGFVQRVQQMEGRRSGMGMGIKLKRILGTVIGKIIVILIILIFIGIAATLVQIPVLSPIVQSVRNMIGI
ncbi:MAG TPA: hypothetical protein PKZ01_12720, partial [Candidatus Hydrogenedentes bacterium]|nr:hypothetical protein [Candidatus Hydrogenedentota bacterium]